MQFTERQMFVLALTALMVFAVGFAFGLQFFKFDLKYAARHARCEVFCGLMRQYGFIDDHIRHKHAGEQCIHLKRMGDAS